MTIRDTYGSTWPAIAISELIDIPAYAPELNPDEGVWNHTKFARLANFAAADVRDLRQVVTAELKELRHRKDLLASFVRHSGLPITVGAIH